MIQRVLLQPGTPTYSTCVKVQARAENSRDQQKVNPACSFKRRLLGAGGLILQKISQALAVQCG